MDYLDRAKYLACKCHSMEFASSETLRNNRKWGVLADKQKEISDGSLNVCSETWEVTFHSFAKGTMRFCGKLQARWKMKKGARKKKQLPKYRNNFTNLCVVPNAVVFLAGCTGTPFLYLLWSKLSHLLRGQGRWDRKTLNKAAKTGWHNNPLLCLRGAESWDVRVCNWMSCSGLSLFFN